MITKAFEVILFSMAFVFIFLYLGSLPAHASHGNATRYYLSVFVKDSKGSPVQGARVEVKICDPNDPRIADKTDTSHWLNTDSAGWANNIGGFKRQDDLHNELCYNGLVTKSGYDNGNIPIFNFYANTDPNRTVTLNLSGTGTGGASTTCDLGAGDPVVIGRDPLGSETDPTAAFQQTFYQFNDTYGNLDTGQYAYNVIMEIFNSACLKNVNDSGTGLGTDKYAKVTFWDGYQPTSWDDGIRGILWLGGNRYITYKDFNGAVESSFQVYTQAAYDGWANKTIGEWRWTRLDKTRPVLDGITANVTTAAPGQTIKFRINARDPNGPLFTSPIAGLRPQAQLLVKRTTDTNWVSLSATLSPSGSYLSSDYTIPADTPAGTTYQAQAFVRDGANLKSTNFGSVLNVDSFSVAPPPDTTAPTGTINAITTPRNTALGTISGTASDNVGVTGMSLVIRRGPDGGCNTSNFDWNGTSWTTACTVSFTPSFTSGASTTWSFANTPPANLMTDGATYRVYINVRDAAGNTSGWSPNVTILYDITAPPAPSIPDLAAASDTGSSETDNITNLTTLTFTGTAEAGSTVRLYRDGVLQPAFGTATSGTWSITLTGQSSGTFFAKATDAAGNTGVGSGGLVVTVDTTAPTIIPRAPSRDVPNNKLLLIADALDPNEPNNSRLNGASGGQCFSPTSSPPTENTFCSGGTFAAFYLNPSSSQWVVITSYISNTPLGKNVSYHNSSSAYFEFEIPLQVNSQYVEKYCVRIADNAGNKSASWDISNTLPCASTEQKTIDASWTQVLGGNVHANSDIDALSPLPTAVPPYNFDRKLSTLGFNRRFNGPAGSTILENYQSSGKADTSGKRSLPYPSYPELLESLYTRADPNQVVKKPEIITSSGLPGSLGLELNQAFFDNLGNDASGSDFVYHVRGDAYIHDLYNFGSPGGLGSCSLPRRGVVFLIDGVLKVFGNYGFCGNNTAVFISKKGIDFDWAIDGEVAGVYVSEGVIDTNFYPYTSPLPTRRFILRGALISIPPDCSSPTAPAGCNTTEFLQLRRSLGSVDNATIPAEKIIFEPKYYIYAQRSAGRSSYIWSEAP